MLSRLKLVNLVILVILFWAQGGPGPIRKRQFGRHAKTVDWFVPIRLLKCHEKWDKGPTRDPGGFLIVGQAPFEIIMQ